MSCDAVAAVALFWLASTGSAHPTTTYAMARPAAVAHEPMFVDIVQRAGRLKAQVATFQGNDKPISAGFKTQVSELSALDMKGHLLLAKRGTDGDLKCILRGISQDLPVKLTAVTTAPDRKTRDVALKEMGYLLRDNVEVITAPPTPPV